MLSSDRRNRFSQQRLNLQHHYLVDHVRKIIDTIHIRCVWDPSTERIHTGGCGTSRKLYHSHHAWQAEKPFSQGFGWSMWLKLHPQILDGYSMASTFPGHNFLSVLTFQPTSSSNKHPSFRCRGAGMFHLTNSEWCTQRFQMPNGRLPCVKRIAFSNTEVQYGSWL